MFGSPNLCGSESMLRTNFSRAPCILLARVQPKGARSVHLTHPKRLITLSSRPNSLPQSIRRVHFHSQSASSNSIQSHSEQSRLRHHHKLKMASTNPSPRRILVLGAGNFGSCLADHLGLSKPLRGYLLTFSANFSLMLLCVICFRLASLSLATSTSRPWLLASALLVIS